MNKLYYSPGACSVGIHVLLEEIGKPYEAVLTNLREGAQFKPEFIALNPKSKVPTLQRDDGSALTEFPAIAYWLATTNPDKKLLPADTEAQARALEAMDYVVSTMHMQGFSRMFRPSNFAPSEADHEAVKARGKEIFEKGLAVMEKAMAGKDYVAGSFSVADAALFYVEFWWADRLGQKLPANLAAHYARMKARPAVAAVLKKEGLAA
ncbi:glutathione S-transferase family protein [Limobrevibacterium gyesilva]|uniref:Glutathione S-transferase N-terminal domain-containing protein n=1 Tax=Limobrevibacterium gyesilva TaxID=2991712 RepID=A0AA41YM60_9PROT|nr:glutathione S-transferase C-terminal domain-containing protein [Limobrevibacterium gyesilva]MCW3476034.1 glutathione S-transferase N-terminal domain-containing protein [Limobrevibacterium gyesilva]